jgi:hypothetical protein
MFHTQATLGDVLEEVLVPHVEAVLGVAINHDSLLPSKAPHDLGRSPRYMRSNCCLHVAHGRVACTYIGFRLLS